MQGMQVRNNGGVIYPLKCTESTQPCAASTLMMLLLTDTLMMIHRTECMNVYRKMRRNYIYIWCVEEGAMAANNDNGHGFELTIK